jgi:hypothetical protein
MPRISLLFIKASLLGLHIPIIIIHMCEMSDVSSTSLSRHENCHGCLALLANEPLMLSELFPFIPSLFSHTQTMELRLGIQNKAIYNIEVDYVSLCRTILLPDQLQSVCRVLSSPLKQQKKQRFSSSNLPKKPKSLRNARQQLGRFSTAAAFLIRR